MGRKHAKDAVALHVNRRPGSSGVHGGRKHEAVEEGEG